MDITPFGSFRTTYPVTFFVMTISMMYPHPKTMKRRIIGALLTTSILFPIFIIVVIDCYNSIMRKELLNIVYHSTVLGPYLGGLMKIFCALYNSKIGDELIMEISRDYSLLNRMSDEYKQLGRDVIKSSLKYCEKYWLRIAVIAISSFPVMSVVLNIKSALFDDNPQRFMIHDVVIPLTEPEYRLETPVYEITYTFMLIFVYVYIAYYSGFESFFGICLNHACLKIDIICLAFEDALKCESMSQRCKKLGDVVEQHSRLFEFINKIQEFFNMYLGLILFAVLIQIGTCLYHIKESTELQPEYVFMAWGSICYIFYPCAFATKLKYASSEMATRMYCAGWENVHCVSTRKYVLFMIARAQVTLELKGLNLVVYDMNLFIAIMKSAYSIYTLLCS